MICTTTKSFTIKNTVCFGTSSWHIPSEACKVVINGDGATYFSFVISKMASGCGSIVASQFYSTFNFFQNEDFFKSNNFKTLENNFLKFLEYCKEDGIGAILTTWGQSHYYKAEGYEKFGFKMIHQYTNYRHGQDYKQRLYILTL